MERDAEQRLTLVEQDGWRVALVHYPREEHGGLPRSLALAQGNQKIRLVIDGWRAEAAP
jgi:outer membrane biogenesis lipoprotein LolB